MSSGLDGAVLKRQEIKAKESDSSSMSTGPSEIHMLVCSRAPQHAGRRRHHAHRMTNTNHWQEREISGVGELTTRFRKEVQVQA
ncbi:MULTISPECIES: hypothetical protein [Streptomyces]|uniref:Transposase n=2 Tax=Streptomyces TaxID=1883 RepID=A0ABV9IT17_9ACTN